MALDRLYHQAVLAHNRQPRNLGPPEQATHQADGRNAICGDHIHFWLRVGDDDQIQAAGFSGEACAITTASASMLTEYLPGLSIAQALSSFEQFEAMMAGEDYRNPGWGEIETLGGVAGYPVRTRSARLPWHAMRAALAGDAVATTESPDRGRSS